MDAQTLVSRYETLKERVANACTASGRKPQDVRIIVVTKTHPARTVQMVVDAGICDIGKTGSRKSNKKRLF
jgi:PLP dependent protein